MSVSEREYYRFEDPWYVHGPIVVMLLSILLERGVTLMFWGLESNPIVNTIGPYVWMVLTTFLIAGVLFIWYPSMGFDVRTDRYLVHSISILHIAAAVTNLSVVIF